MNPTLPDMIQRADDHLAALRDEDRNLNDRLDRYRTRMGELAAEHATATAQRAQARADLIEKVATAPSTGLWASIRAAFRKTPPAEEVTFLRESIPDLRDRIDRTEAAIDDCRQRIRYAEGVAAFLRGMDVCNRLSTALTDLAPLLRQYHEHNHTADQRAGMRLPSPVVPRESGHDVYLLTEHLRGLPMGLRVDGYARAVGMLRACGADVTAWTSGERREGEDMAFDGLRASLPGWLFDEDAAVAVA